MTKPKIAIIGGGPAGLSAAFHLTRDDDWRETLESVTVYQLGWRLGGKGATGRDASTGWRIEEHGIHGFCSFYYNTWRMMKQIYDDLPDRARKQLPVDKIENAFLPSSLTYGVDWIDGRPHPSKGHLPHTPGSPWDQRWHAASPRAIARGILEQMLRRGRAGSLEDLDSRDLIARTPDGEPLFLDITGASTIDAEIRASMPTSEPLSASAEANLLPYLPSWESLVQRIQGRLGEWLDRAVDAARNWGTVTAYRALTTLDLYAALLLGLIRDGILVGGQDFDTLDAKDYRAWLQRHGASSRTLASSSVLSVANLLFAYPDGVLQNGPSLSTASWLNWMLRSVTGRGAYFYFMAAGTGETAILPLYLWLLGRGVKFEFFHKLVGVESDQLNGKKVLRRLRFERQASTKEAADYEPLDWLLGRSDEQSWKTWPNEPRWSQLENGDDLKNQNVDFEAWKGSPIPGNKSHPLELGNEFHHVVWAIPPSMIEEVGDSTLRAEWADISSRLPTTATQAVQIWLDKSTPELGWKTKGSERYASASFPDPLNGMVVFDDVISFEAWPAQDKPRGLIYLCGQLELSQPPDEASRPAARKAVHGHALDSLQRFGDFMPDARPNPHDPAHPQAIDFDLLHCPHANLHAGGQRLLCQYLRANTRPTEAYVQAPPGSRQGRRFAWDTGYQNVVVAGDWIYTGFNLGAFESAVTGGKLAAFALTGRIAIDEIEGYDFHHPEAKRRACEALQSGRVPIIP